MTTLKVKMILWKWGHGIDNPRVLTFIHNYVWKFWFITRNVKNPKTSQNEFQWTTKHVFWQDYFLHMWPTPKTLWTHWTYFFVKWFKKWVLCLTTLFLKFWHFCAFWFFIKVIQWTCTFLEGGMWCAPNSLRGSNVNPN